MGTAIHRIGIGKPRRLELAAARGCCHVVILPGLGEAKGVVDDTHCVINLLFSDGDGDFDLRGGYHLNVNASLSQGSKHLGSDAGVGAHTDANYTELGHFGLGENTNPFAKFGEHRFRVRSRLVPSLLH